MADIRKRNGSKGISYQVRYPSKRSKTGFGVPTRTWMATAAGLQSPAGEAGEPKGLVSRRWSRVVLGVLGAPTQTLAS